MVNIATVLLFFQLIELSVGKQIVLLDSSKLSSLDWKTWSENGEEDTQGWIEESVPVVPDGLNTRSYVTCDIKRPHVDNWLQLPLIERLHGNRLSVEISFTIRDCKESEFARICKETFSLLYRETDAVKDFSVYYEVCEQSMLNFAIFPETPVGSEASSMVSVEGGCVDHSAPYFGSVANPPSPRRVCKANGHWDLMSGGCHCQPGFRADGQESCSACPVDYYKDSPGIGACVPCPRSSHTPSNASAYCVCDAGSFRAPDDHRSAPCTHLPSKPENLRILLAGETFADFAWSAPLDLGSRSELWYKVQCSGCPSRALFEPPNNNRLNGSQIRVRNLDAGQKYTLLVYSANALLFHPLAEPSVATLKFSTKSSADGSETAKFRGSSNAGGRGSGTVLHDRGFEGVNDELPSDDAASSSWAPRLRIDSLSEKQITLAWEDSDEAAAILSTQQPQPRRRYEVELRYADDVGYDSSHVQRVATTNQSKWTFSNLVEDADYAFRVRSMLRENVWTSWSPSLSARTNFMPMLDSETTVAFSDNAKYIWILVTVLFVFLLGVLFCIFCTRKTFHPSTLKNLFSRSKLVPSRRLKSPNEFEYNGFPINNPNVAIDTYPIMAGSTTPLCFAPTLKRAEKFQLYIDPSNYEDPSQILHEFANEIEPRIVIIEEIIGSGEFGDVCKGLLKIDHATANLYDCQNLEGCQNVDGCHNVTVAIKTLKFGSSPKSRQDFLSEAFIMGQFQHPNVVALIGVVSKNEPVMIISEFMQNGSLNNFLKGKESVLEYMCLTKMLLHIAQGMKYLTDKRYIHRDLAARNVLVDSFLTCKIADFGLSRFANSVDRTYTTNGGKIPVRWTAPEAISLREFTAASDVWSFGVCSWETLTYGKRPYGNWLNEEVIGRVENGFRLLKPANCPDAIYNLMLSCWRYERESRPTFGSICSTLHELLINSAFSYETVPICVNRSDGRLLTASATVHCNSTLNQASYGVRTSLPSLSTSHLPSNADHTSPQALMLSTVDVDHFMRAVGLYDKYGPKLKRHGVCDSLTLWRLLNADQLTSLGVAADDQRAIWLGLQQLDRLSGMS